MATQLHGEEFGGSPLPAGRCPFEELVENLPAGVFSVVNDDNGKLVTANPALARLLGYESKDELIGLKIDQFVVKPTALLPLKRLISSGRGPVLVQLELRRRDGTRFWAEIAARSGNSESGSSRVYGTVGDITDFKLAEDALRESEEALAKTEALLLSAIEQVPAGIIIAEPPDVKIRVANSAALKIRGTSPVPSTDIPVEYHPQNWQTYHPDGSPIASEDLPLSRAVLKGETSNNVELVIQRHDGESRFVIANAAPVKNARGEIIAGVVVFPDITDSRLPAPRSAASGDD